MDSTEKNQLKLPPVGVFVSEVWELLKKRFGIMAVLSLFSSAVGSFMSVFVFFLLLIAVFVLFGIVAGFDAGGVGDLMNYFTTGMPIFMIVLIGAAAVVLFMAVQAFFVGSLNHAGIEDKSSFGDSLGFAMQHLLGLFAVLFLVSLLTSIGWLLFIIPGIYLSVSFSLAYVVYVKEGKRGYDCLKRSMQLVKGYWWAVFGRYLLIGCLLMAVGFGAGVILAVLDQPELSAITLNAIQILVFMPVFVIQTIVIYRQLVERNAS